MSKTLQGKVALVTGASRGIGKGIALELAAAGAKVYITARSVDSRVEIDPKFGHQPVGTASEVVAEATAAGGKMVAIKCDHAVDDQVRSVISQIEKAEGHLDILVNNAMASEAALWGLGPEHGGKPFWQVPMEAWDMMMTIGLRSHYAATVFAMPLLLKSKGLVVNITAMPSEIYWGSIPFCVEKMGGDRITREMAREVGPGSVTFLSMWPGFVETERLDSVPGWKERLLPRYQVARDNISKRTGRPKEKATTDTMEMESQRFTGMAVVALASDPDVNRYSGQICTSAGTAEKYGYKDATGTVADGFGFRIPGVWKKIGEQPV